MTVQQKYKENEQLITAYKDYLLCRVPDAASKKKAWMFNEADQNDEDELIEEIARLIDENRDMREQLIINQDYFKNEYFRDTNFISSQFDVAY